MSTAPSIAERIRENRDTMTRSEAQLVEVILDEYPVSGLCSITELADKAGVSSPTVGRLLQKLGYGGYGDFQAALRAELSEMISDPIAKRVHLEVGPARRAHPGALCGPGAGQPAEHARRARPG